MSNRWAILIGINGYHESLGPLNFCTNDAKLMQETLVSECCGFPMDNVIILTDDQPKDRQPTFGNIHSWLGTWLSRPGPDDLVLVYFAGHGREANGQALLAPLDATLDSMPVTGIPIQYVRDILDRCKARQKVLILDACHSGAGRDVATMSTGFREALDTGTGLYTIASCDANQISYEWPEKQHGVFTHYLVEAIRHGAPVEPDGRVLLDRVYDWARNGILAWTAGKRLKQEPVRICHVKGDIHIASRSLSLEQQLAAANARAGAQRETIQKLRNGVEHLAEENAKLKKEIEARSKARKSAQVPHRRNIAEVPEWSRWVNQRGPYYKTVNWLDNGVFSLATAGLWLIVVAVRARHSYVCSQNSYRLVCAEVCIKAKDYIGGSQYACAMGRKGVDQAKGAAAVVELANLAASDGDIETAKLLYEHAMRRWKSPYAKRALAELQRE